VVDKMEDMAQYKGDDSEQRIKTGHWEGALYLQASGTGILEQTDAHNLCILGIYQFSGQQVDNMRHNGHDLNQDANPTSPREPEPDILSLTSSGDCKCT
jgi:hypothetical protein